MSGGGNFVYDERVVAVQHLDKQFVQGLEDPPVALVGEVQVVEHVSVADASVRTNQVLV